MKWTSQRKVSFLKFLVQAILESHKVNFSSCCRYASKALDRADVLIPPTEMTSPDTVQNLDRWKDVVVLYTLRLLLAPLVETVVLWDRLLFLKENGKPWYNEFNSFSYLMLL